MDRRAYPSYEVGFDACDPLGSVLEWSERGDSRAARVLRRRCRSEGVERSPYDDAHRESRLESDVACFRAHQRVLPNKSHFTINSYIPAHYEAFHHECQLPNGDYLMAHEQHRLQNFHSGKTKHNRLSPSRNVLVTPLTNSKVDDRLPKVDELLEKVDQEMMEVAMAKQPLKSILNNPIPKSVPPGILKKPKNKSYQDPRLSYEGRRRQRASSESDNICTFHLASPIPGFDSRLTYLSSNTKRAKDNSGTGYSYNSAIASLSNNPVSKNGAYKQNRCSCKDQVVLKNDHDSHILRTTAITNDCEKTDSVVDVPRLDAPCPLNSPSLPVTSFTSLPAPKKTVKTGKKKVKAKSKSTKLKNGTTPVCNNTVESEDQESLSRSPSPDTLTWQMETDTLIAEMDKLEKAHSPVATRPQSPSPKKQEEVTGQVSVTKLSAKLTNGAIVTPKKTASKEETSCALPESITSCLRPSLFPRVPPYLKFVSHDEAALKVPLAIQKHLKWKLTTITPIVVKKTLMNSGFRLVKSECDTAECPQEETVEWVGIWGKHMKSLMFRAIKDGQKMNHFPGTFQIGRKDRLWRNLQKLVSKFGLEEFGIMPKTYVLPHDLKILKHDWEKHAENNERWIIKPPASARGTGIKVVSRWTQIPKKRPVVVQKYVSKPYLINGSKFDMRLYVLVTSIHPLRIYLYKDGLARFASVKYNDELSSLNDRYMHLTNYSINRLSKNYTPNEDFSACEGHKWTLQSLFHYLKTEKNVDTDALWESMKDLVIKTIIAGEASISSLTKANITSRYNCYELFGVDVLLDEDLKPWLLEVNISPSLHSASPLDIHVKGPLVTAVLNVAQFQVPVKTNLESLSKDKPHKLAGLPYDCRLYTIYLSKEERDKHIIYTNMEDRDMYLADILSTLTPDDVRHLLQAEDELAAAKAGGLERVFPARASHRYLPFLPGARYYNRLFDAWETRYCHQRHRGVELLRNLCEIGYHLEVPPVPLKRPSGALSALAPSRMTWTRPHRPPRSSRSSWWRRPRRPTPSTASLRCYARRSTSTPTPNSQRPPTPTS